VRNPNRKLEPITRFAVLLPCLLGSFAAGPVAGAFDPSDPDPTAGNRSGSPTALETPPEVLVVSGFPGGSVGLDVLGVSPQGEFSRYVGSGFGILGYFRVMFGPESRVGLRLDAGLLNYGHEVTSLNLGRVWYDVSTDNNVYFATFGPQVEVGGSDVRLFGNGFVGLSYFATESSVSDWPDSPYTVNYDDLVPAFGVGGGIQIKLKKGVNPPILNLGVRYQMHPTTEYLTKGDVVDTPGGTYLYPVESRTDMLLFQVGIAVGGYR
jgi:hypothetical protein